MTNIQLSLFGSAVRTPFWLKYFNQFKMNKINYEIIFAGPVKPSYKLPDNVKYLYVHPDPGPVHCASLAATYCVGETLIPSADDVVFSPFSLDYMYDEYKKQNDYKCMVHARYGFGPDSDVTDVNNELPIPGTQWRFAIGILYSARFYWELGGNDRRYRGGASEGDLQMRALASGGRYVYAYNAYVQEDISYIDNNALSPKRAWQRWYGREDNDFMRRQWFPNGVMQKQSTVPFEPIDVSKYDSTKHNH